MIANFTHAESQRLSHPCTLACAPRTSSLRRRRRRRRGAAFGALLGGALAPELLLQRDEINDRFDAKWLEQQAAAGALTLGEVHNLMLYVARTIEGWQAPADATAAAAWVAEVTGLVEALSLIHI